MANRGREGERWRGARLREDLVEKLRRWRCGRARSLKPEPQGEGEVCYFVCYWRGEAELSGGSVGLVKGHAELTSPEGCSLPYTEPCRRQEVKLE